MRTRRLRGGVHALRPTRGAEMRVTLDQPVTVSNNLMGMCLISWPVSGHDPTGVLNYNCVRMLQTRFTFWADIERTPGVYRWDEMDQIVTFQRSNRKAIYWGLGGTPRFYADNTIPNPIITDFNAVGVWGWGPNGPRFGEGAMPTSLVAMSAFITAGISRYNLPGGAWFDRYGAVLGKGIQYWQTWNEPESFYNPGTGAGNGATVVGGQSNRHGWMSREQLIDLHVTQHATIKAIDPTVIVTTPGFTGRTPEWIGAALTLVGPVTGRTMGATSDALAFHPYYHTPLGWGTYRNHVLGNPLDYGFSGVFALREAMHRVGYGTMPLWISEWGVDSRNTSPEIIDWNNRPPAYRRQWIAGMYASCAVLGVETLCPWHWELNGPVTTAGAYQRDVTGAQAGFNLAAENLRPGRIITGYTYRMHGEMEVIFSDGSTWRIHDNMPLPGPVPINTIPLPP